MSHDAAAAPAHVPDKPGVPERECPECGAMTPADPRFVVWCAGCGWNADPLPPEPPQGRLQGRRRRTAARYGEQLYAELARSGPGAPRLDASGVAAHVLAWAVHLSTVAVAVAGVLLITTGGAFALQVLLGAVLLLVVVSLRPRLGRLPKDAVTLRRDTAPGLYALLDRIAAESGTRPVDVVVLDASVNAGVTEYGLRRRRLLVLGLPLWHMLGPQQRVALLGHEFGHYANGDQRRGLVVGTALTTLGTWHHVLRPSGQRGRPVVQIIADLIMVPPWLFVLGLLHLLDHFTLRATQRAEYRADLIGARIGSGAAAAECTDELLLAESVDRELRRQAVLARTRTRASDREDAAAGLWGRLADHARDIPARERERLRRVAELRGHSTDSTHPPTHLRRALLLDTARDLPAAVTLDAAGAAAIDAEIAPAARQAARWTLRDLHL
ncbi:M48 family metallopeptidase [Actinacidiphila paucisporea]|uniref:Zn-dependent protease with chaperone function n=1 Tax=Actinacidiphila paucisporea TaxID=310782 RepID=A0A1M7H468_9ACTN|nr:M48 family metallopeptidase [Actinacidiphila paucisporea]SHM23178.1 Zn-dependent protease with chaperone function [Actinacidiphila paucisporea]